MTATPRDRYDTWLQERAPGSHVLPGPKLGESPYELFSAAGGPPGAKLHPAAVSARHVVTPNDPDGWGPFLSSAVPTVIQAQIGWLHGSWVSHRPGAPASAQVLARDPKAKKYVTEPVMAPDADGNLVFEAYYGQPPSMDPFRFTVKVDKSGGATFTNEPVWKLP